MNTQHGPSLIELVPGRWYALHLHEGHECYLSPIRVDSVEWFGKKRDKLKLRFFLLNYPEGVQDMEWSLKMLQATPSFLVARSLDTLNRVIILAERMAIIGDHSQVEARNGQSEPTWRAH